MANTNKHKLLNEFWKIFFTTIGIFYRAFVYANDLPPTCQGGISAIIDRPSVAYGACTVPAQQLYIEQGFDYQILTPKSYGYNLPQTELRYGLTNHTEIAVNTPNYFSQVTPKQTGTSAINIGLKQELYYDAHQLLTWHGYIVPASGSYFVGTDKTSFLLQGIYSYSFDSGINVAGTLGWASNAAPPAAPAPTFYTFNPIVDIGWSFNETVSGYLELYSQSKTSLDAGWGLSFDGGIIIQLMKNLTCDFSGGQRIVGYQNNTDHYFGTGFAISLG